MLRGVAKPVASTLSWPCSACRVRCRVSCGIFFGPLTHAPFGFPRLPYHDAHVVILRHNSRKFQPDDSVCGNARAPEEKHDD